MTNSADAFAAVNERTKCKYILWASNENKKPTVPCVEIQVTHNWKGWRAWTGCKQVWHWEKV